MIEDEWCPVGPGTPLGAWLETRCEGEASTNVCLGRMLEIGGDVEWVERAPGVTTVTHLTFVAPTHWRWPRIKDPRETALAVCQWFAGLPQAGTNDPRRYYLDELADKITNVLQQHKQPTKDEIAKAIFCHEPHGPTNPCAGDCYCLTHYESVCTLLGISP